MYSKIYCARCGVGFGYNNDAPFKAKVCPPCSEALLAEYLDRAQNLDGNGQDALFAEYAEKMGLPAELAQGLIKAVAGLDTQTTVFVMVPPAGVYMGLDDDFELGGT